MAECKSAAEVGSITWVINGKDYTLEADEWILEQGIDFTQTNKPIEIGVGPLGPQMLV
jgi:hypothetical protein